MLIVHHMDSKLPKSGLSLRACPSNLHFFVIPSDFKRDGDSCNSDTHKITIKTTL